MGRITILMGIWLLGYLIGFIGYLIFPLLLEALASLLPALLKLDGRMLSAALAGLASSIITLAGVFIWARWSAPAR